MQSNRWLRFNVFALDSNYLECQEPQKCILKVSMQLINFSELQIFGKKKKICLKFTGNAESFVRFLKNRDSRHPVEKLEVP